MSEYQSALNRRRRGEDLHIRDKDLLTGRDCRRLIAEAMQDHEERDADRRGLELDGIRVANALYNALPWWKRAMRALAFRRDELRDAQRSAQ